MPSTCASSANRATLPAETEEARPLGRVEWFAIGVAVAVLLAVVFLLLGAAGISHG